MERRNKTQRQKQRYFLSRITGRGLECISTDDRHTVIISHDELVEHVPMLYTMDVERLVDNTIPDVTRFINADIITMDNIEVVIDNIIKSNPLQVVIYTSKSISGNTIKTLANRIRGRNILVDYMLSHTRVMKNIRPPENTPVVYVGGHITPPSMHSVLSILNYYNGKSTTPVFFMPVTELDTIVEIYYSVTSPVSIVITDNWDWYGITTNSKNIDNITKRNVISQIEYTKRKYGKQYLSIDPSIARCYYDIPANLETIVRFEN